MVQGPSRQNGKAPLKMLQQRAVDDDDADADAANLPVVVRGIVEKRGWRCQRSSENRTSCNVVVVSIPYRIPHLRSKPRLLGRYLESTVNSVYYY